MKAATALRLQSPASWPGCESPAQHSTQSYLNPLVEDGEVGICLQLLKGEKKLKSPI